MCRWRPQKFVVRDERDDRRRRTGSPTILGGPHFPFFVSVATTFRPITRLSGNFVTAAPPLEGITVVPYGRHVIIAPSTGRDSIDIPTFRNLVEKGAQRRRWPREGSAWVRWPRSRGPWICRVLMERYPSAARYAKRAGALMTNAQSANAPFGLVCPRHRGGGHGRVRGVARPWW